jgi:hypothetical protein
LTDSKKVVGIAGAASPTGGPLFEWLEQILPVRFERRNAGELNGLDAVIAWGGILEKSALEVPSLHIPHESSGDRFISSGEVQFGGSEEIPKEFRAHQFHQEDIRLGALPRLMDGDVNVTMACFEGDPLWVRRQYGASECDVSAMPLPEVKVDGCLYHCFHSRNFVRLLPLMDFLRRITGEKKWHSPGPRACFQFDDPNLHSERYGWLNFKQLAASARSSGYHVALATVPLDAWLVRRGAAKFFSRNPGPLSLLTHGNDHVHSELMSFGSQEKAIASMAQALKRIERAERAANVEVCRVMAPPHGLCGEDVLYALARLGFEAVSTAIPSLYAANANKSWAHALGLRVSEVVASLPVLPRFRFKTNRCYSAIHLAAYLRMPILPYGHHEDVSSGVGILEDIARSINTLGNVQWMRMSEIARNNFQTQTESGFFRVRAYSRRLRVTVPEECYAISIERPWSINGGEPLRLCGPDGATRLIESYAGESLPMEPGSTVEIFSPHAEAIDWNSVKIPKSSPWALGRRLLCETRDRCAPLAGRLRKSPAA